MKKWHSKSRKILSAITAAVVLFASCSGYFVKDVSVKADTLAKKSSNIHQHSYMYNDVYKPLSNWANPVCSYLFTEGGDILTRVEKVHESDGDSIVVEQYEKADFSLKSASTIPMELSKFGGFYAGENYNYFVFGQDNPEGQDTCEVLRVVQYTKDWTRIASASVYGANTFTIFEGGSLQMCESGNTLYIRTCHEMYQSSDCLNHQSNMTICYNSSSHIITDESNVNCWGTGYVSHSFNQLIKVDGNDMVTMDHGDAYPRAFVLMKYEDAAGREMFDKRPSSVQILSFSGETGDNRTGASVGGLEASRTNYLTAYTTVDQEFPYTTVRNISVAAVSKSDFSASSLQTTQYTSFEGSGLQSASNPVLVKISENEFMLMWEIYDADAMDTVGKYFGTHTIQYVKIDGEGKPLGEVNTAEGDLSDCQPLVLGNEIMWYVTNAGTPVFYELDTTTEKLTSTYTEVPPTATPVSTDKPITKTPQPTATKKPATNSKTRRTVPVYTTNTRTTQGTTTTTVPKVKGLTAKNLKGKKMKCSWNKVQNASYYSVQIARNRSFTKERKTIEVYGTTKYTRYSLKKKKTYYVRVRAWRFQNGRYVAGKWSGVKKVKIKK